MAIQIAKKPKIKINSIEEAITRLIHSKNFYAVIIAGVTRRAVPEEICGTMAVVCNPETYLGIELIYCQKFIESLEDMEYFEFVVEHECVHLVLQHIQRFWTDKRLRKVAHDTFNIAADMATNEQIIKHYPGLKERVTEKFWLPEKEQLEPEKAMEIYALLLDMKAKKTQCPLQAAEEAMGMSGAQPGPGQGQQKGNCPSCGGTHKGRFGQGAVNPHLWGFKVVDDGNGGKKLVPATEKELGDSSVKQELNLPDYIQQCVDNYTKDQGSLPGYIQDMIKDFLRLKKEISWQEILFSRVSSGMPFLRQRSIMRTNRRLWGIPQAFKFPGKVTQRAYKVALIMDTSGSMSQEDLKAAAATLKSLMDYYKSIKVWIAHADTEIHKIQELQDISEFDFKVYGRGGTDFARPIEQIEEKVKPDIILYFTDGYGGVPAEPPKAKIIWFITEGGQDPVKHLGNPYGEVIYVKYK